ncbi:hypothetical protein [Nocardia sp. CA-290969]|uniref:hypothetical protein n=1 Tax=Nocardia sp. CA-290969 TaxID=3239986 RepID=UPI003D89F3A7
MSEVVIEVSVPHSADITAVADEVDITPDPSGAQVILVPGAGGGIELDPEDIGLVVDEVLDELTPPVSLILLLENGMA